MSAGSGHKPDPDHPFFLRCGLGLIGCIALGFGGRALVQGEEQAPELLVLLRHIACIGGWYLLFTVQG